MDGKFTRILVFLSAFFLSSTLFGFTVQISSTNVTCNGANDGTATANIVNGNGSTYTFSWSTGASGQQINSLAPGNYSVTATDANGATATSSVYISEPAPLSVQMSSSYETCDISHDGTAGVLAFGGTPVGSYDVLWSDGQTGWVAYNLASGDYSVTVTDANACTVVGNVTVEPSPEGIWISTHATDVSCAGDCDGTSIVMPMTGVQPYTYEWNNGQTTQSATGLCPGDYHVTVTDANGCFSVGNTTVNEPPVLDVTTTSTPSGCAGTNTGSASASANGGTPGYGYTYSWSNGGTGATIMDLAPGDYTVTVTDSNGCSATSTVTVGQSASSNLGFTLSADDVTCNGNCDGSASINITSGTAPYSYSWSNGSTGNSISGLCAGQYSVTVSDASGCPIAQVFTIGTPDAIDLAFTSTNTNCGASDGTATVVATGGNGGYSYNWTNGQSTATATGLNPGLQGVTVTDQVGCTASGSVTVGQTGSNIDAYVTTVDATCRTNSDGSATVVVTSGTAPYTYTWSNGASGANATGLAAGSYTVTVTDASGCPLTLDVVISAPADIVVSLTTTPATCGNANGTVTSSVSGGTGSYTYLWDYNNETTPNLNGVPAGNYLLTVADENLCLGYGTATVAQQGGQVVATVASTPTLCSDSNDGTATITVTSGDAPYTYAWENNASTTATASGLASGSYGWTVTDATGCMATGMVDVTSPDALDLTTTTTNATCGGANGSATVTVTGGTAPYTYKWNDTFGQTGPHAMALEEGTYTVLVTDDNGCTASTTVTVGSTQGFTCNAVVTSSYNGAHISSIGGNDGSATVTMNGGNPGYFSFAWSNGQTSQQITGLSAGTYTVVVKDDLTGCTCESSVTLEDPAKLGNYVWIDANSNGIQDAGEAGVEGVAVQVTGTSAYGLVLDLTTTTDVNGMYMFTLPPGDYKVTFTKPANHDFTLANQGGDDTVDSDVDPTMGMTQVVTLTSGEYNPDLDAGLIKNCVSVGDFVWYDIDQDGLQENGAAGVEGFVVNLISAGPDGDFNTADDVVEASTTTDNTGHYLFDCVTPGTYVIEFDPSSLPAGYQFTKKDAVFNDGKDSDAGETGRTVPFTVTIADGDNLTLDAGIHTECDNVTNPGTIGYNQSICPNQVPDKLVTLVEASGGSGPLEFIWMKAQPGAPFAPIPGSTTTDYQPPALFNTTVFRKCARRAGCYAYLEPPAVTITVKDTCGSGFVSLSGAPIGDAIALNWVTGAENGEYTYQVERSANGENFFAMDLMLGHGINNGFNNYTYMDEHPRKGTNYYRIIMNGPNDFEMASDVIKVMGHHTGKDLAIFPNPAGEVFYIDIMQDDVTDGQVQLFDTNGKLVKTFSVEAGNSGPRRFLIPELTSGVYFVKVTVGDTVEMMKLRKE